MTPNRTNMKRTMCIATFAKPYGFPDLPRRIPAPAAIAKKMPVTTKLFKTESMSLPLREGERAMDTRLCAPLRLLPALNGQFPSVTVGVMKPYAHVGRARRLRADFVARIF